MGVEKKRGCGFRKAGGLYLCGDGPGMHCDRLPFSLERCPVCQHGIKQTRGWTWLNAPELLGHRHMRGESDQLLGHPCRDWPMCAMCNPDDILPYSAELVDDDERSNGPRGKKKEELLYSAGLLWIGTQFYPTPEDFLKEAQEMGVSRRITAVPRNFKLGETWILFAHPKAIREGDGLPGHGPFKPGIFQAFQPNRIEKCLADDSSPEEREKWEKKGYKVVLLPAGDKDHQGDVYHEEEEDE